MQSCFRMKNRPREEKEKFLAQDRKNRYEKRVKMKWVKNAVNKAF